MNLRLVISILVFCCSILQAAYQNVVWNNPTPTGNDIYGVASNSISTIYVLVGEDGTIASAQDGRTWQFRVSNTIADLHDCVFGPQFAVAVGDEGTILTSTDGETWTLVSGQTANFKAVVYGLGLFIAVGELNGNAYAATSINGQSWSALDVGLTSPLNDIAYSGSAFVVVGDNGAVARSPSGSSWTSPTPFTGQDLVSITDAIGQFVAIGDANSGERIFTSLGGTDWNSLSAGSDADGLNFNAIAYFSGIYTILADQGKILTTTSTNSWLIRQVRENYDGSYLALSGSALGTNIVGRGGAIYISINGLTDWTQFAQGAQGTYHDLEEGGGFYVAVGDDGRIGGSADLISWVNRTNDFSIENLSAVTYGNTTWIAVGEKGTILASLQNGDNWTARNSPTTQNLTQAAFGNGRYLAAGENGTLLSSTDTNGLNWSLLNLPTSQDVTALEYINDLFLAGTSDGTVLLSTEGTSWQQFTNALTGQVNGFATLGDKFYALSNDLGDSTLYTSTNGQLWTSVHTASGANLNSLASNDTWLTAISEDGNVLSSEDGTSWTLDTGVLTPGLLSLVNANGRLLATGQYAKIPELKIGASLDDYFANTTELSPGWLSSPWLGAFNYLDFPIIYAADQGFWSCSGPGASNNQNSYWFYDYVLGWLWTADGTYPWIFISDRNNWAYWGETDGQFRWFFFNDVQDWQVTTISDIPQ